MFLYSKLFLKETSRSTIPTHHWPYPRTSLLTSRELATRPTPVRGTNSGFLSITPFWKSGPSKYGCPMVDPLCVGSYVTLLFRMFNYSRVMFFLFPGFVPMTSNHYFFWSYESWIGILWFHPFNILLLILERFGFLTRVKSATNPPLSIFPSDPSQLHLTWTDGGQIHHIGNGRPLYQTKNLDQVSQ